MTRTHIATCRTQGYPLILVSSLALLEKWKHFQGGA